MKPREMLALVSLLNHTMTFKIAI